MNAIAILMLFCISNVFANYEILDNAQINVLKYGKDSNTGEVHIYITGNQARDIYWALLSSPFRKDEIVGTNTVRVSSSDKNVVCYSFTTQEEEK